MNKYDVLLFILDSQVAYFLSLQVRFTTHSPTRTYLVPPSTKLKQINKTIKSLKHPSVSSKSKTKEEETEGESPSVDAKRARVKNHQTTTAP
jgi:hypothetical protein